ncbi:hypothetical protein IFR05_001204 [Cadophora sp. M221]|nr:hypothetical protein IFR05_001204 [Cadophora sp. M221]
MEKPEQTLCARVEALISLYPPSSRRRIIISLVGGPGSGKSTISAALAKTFNSRNTEQLTVVPMDGFHYSKTQLSTLQLSECGFRRRGAPFTFDSPSFVQLVHSLRDNPVTEVDTPAYGIYAPSFDHAVKDPVENDIFISSSQRIIVLEGSYLLLDEEPWNQISQMVDESWFIDVAREVAKTRLIKRHIQAGIENNWDDALWRVESNDLLNLDLVIGNKGFPNVIINNSGFTMAAR